MNRKFEVKTIRKQIFLNPQQHLVFSRDNKNNFT